MFYLMAMMNDTVITMILRLLNVQLADDKNCPLMNEGCSNQMLLRISRNGDRERSGRVLDSRPRGRGLEPHWRHCLVVLEQYIFILA